MIVRMMMIGLFLGIPPIAFGGDDDATIAAQRTSEARTKQMHAERMKAIGAAIAQLRNAGSDQERANWCWVLGQLRATEALPDLLKHLPLRLPIGEGFELPRWGERPAQEALTTIGSPSIPALIRHVKQHEDEATRKLSLQTISMILLRASGDAELARRWTRELLLREAELTTHPVEKLYLMRAVEMVGFLGA